jgi:hypothetical protein
MERKNILINNYENKQRILQLGLDKTVRQLKKSVYCASLDAYNSGDYTGYDESLKVYKDIALEMGDDFMVATNLNKSRWNRISRIREKNEYIINTGKALFLTLTFTNDTLSNTTEETRRSYVARYLKRQCGTYLANVDYGLLNEREHYHAVVLPIDSKVDLSLWRKYGNINVKRIGNDKLDNLKTAKYLAKLTHHAIKNNGKLKRLIYSRNLL